MDQAGFLNSLRYCGLEIRKKEVVERLDGSSKVECELDIVADMIRIAEEVDTVIVEFGNGVFADGAPLLNAKGVRFECCGFMERMSTHLKDAVDRYWWLGEEHLW